MLLRKQPKRLKALADALIIRYTQKTRTSHEIIEGRHEWGISKLKKVLNEQKIQAKTLPREEEVAPPH